MRTNSSTRLRQHICAILLGTAVAGLGATANATEIVATKRATVDGQSYTFVKKIDEKGELTSQITTERGAVIAQSAVSAAKTRIVAPDVEAALAAAERAGGGSIKVSIALDLPTESADEAPTSGQVETLNGLVTARAIDGKDVSEQKFAELEQKTRETQKEEGRKVAETRQALTAGFLERNGMIATKGAKESLAQASTSVTLEIDHELLKRLIASGDKLVRGIELYNEGEDDISQAMVDTSVSSSALPFSSTRGSGIGVYMTESGCANESRITNYDRLSGSETNHSRNVGAIIRAVSPNARLYCRGGAVLPTIWDMIGFGITTPIHIVTRSNSTNDNRSYTTLDRDWDNFAYSWNIATFNSGGNTGNGTGNVRSPGKGLNLVTVANYNDSNNTVVSSSPFRDPLTGNEKPEVAAPGASITAGGFTMTGTSQATPHAAAFSADMMSGSSYLRFRPYLVKAKLLAGATDSISGGYDKVGLGGIDFASAHWSGNWAWWSGNNGSFLTHDANDGVLDGYVSRKVYISGGWSNVRAVLSWMNRGTYTYDHRNDSHAIGMDLDLRVYDPNGNYVGGSFSWDDGFEDVNFDPAISGYYTFKIKRYANRDTSSSLRMGLYVNFY